MGSGSGTHGLILGLEEPMTSRSAANGVLTSQESG
jgi:hypothetical protein